MDLQCPENTVFKNLCSLRMLKGAGCEEVYTNLFETSISWQVFKVGVSSVPQKVSSSKRLLKSKKDYQGGSTMTFYVYFCQNDGNQFCDIT